MLSLASPEMLLVPIAVTRGVFPLVINLQLGKNSRPGRVAEALISLEAQT
jgi:hypothetical protein